MRKIFISLVCILSLTSCFYKAMYHISEKDKKKKNRFIHIAYYNYWREDIRDHYVTPLCVKLFRQRWYMVARKWPANTDIIFCLDRIRDLRLSSHTFEYPKEFCPQEYFDGCFGVIAGGDCDIQKVRLN